MKFSSKPLEEQMNELIERLDRLEAEIKRLRITPKKLIEARAWAIIYELKCKPPVNGTMSMSSYECADFLENGIDHDELTMPNASYLVSNVIKIMELAADLDTEIEIGKVGPKKKKVTRLIYRPKKCSYTFKDLLADYS